MSQKSKLAELRRVAREMGYRIERCPSRKPGTLGFGGFMVMYADDHDFVVAGDSPFEYSFSLLDVENYLIEREREISELA